MSSRRCSSVRLPELRPRHGVLGDAILLSFVEYLLAYESYGMREVWLARRLWIASGSSQYHGKTAPWSPVQFVQEVKEVTRDRYVECEKSGWFAKAGGCKAVIKQRAGTVLMAVLELKDFVSEGLKYDVTGYGATAWSIITFGLRVSFGTGIESS